MDNWDSVDFEAAAPFMKSKSLQRKWSDEDLEERDANNVIKDSWEEEEEVPVKGDEVHADVYDSWEEIPEDSWVVSAIQRKCEGEGEEAEDSWDEAEGEAEDSWDAELESVEEDKGPVLLEGEVPAPDVEQLTSALTLTYAKPRSLLAQSWICPNCWKIFYGSKNFIADIQELECSECKMKNPTSYWWTLTRCSLHGIFLDFTTVYDQKRDPYCLLFSFLSLCDLARVIRGAKHKCEEGMPFNSRAMHAHFQNVSGLKLGENPEAYGYVELGKHPAVEFILIAAYRYGVPYLMTHYDVEHCHVLPRGHGEHAPPPSRDRSLKVSSWFRVSGRDVDKITRLIAHGIPLLAVIPVGKCFDFVGGKEIYCAPDPDDCGLHAVVVHGSGVEMPDADLREAEPGTVMEREVFLRCRNSHGCKRHPLYENKGHGSDFNIWAVHLYGDVFGINLESLYS